MKHSSLPLLPARRATPRESANYKAGAKIIGHFE